MWITISTCTRFDIGRRLAPCVALRCNHDVADGGVVLQRALVASLVVAGCDEVPEMCAEVLMGVGVEAFAGRVPDRAVHAPDLSVGPRVVRFGQAAFDPVGCGNHVEAYLPAMCGIRFRGCSANWIPLSVRMVWISWGTISRRCSCVDRVTSRCVARISVTDRYWCPRGPRCSRRRRNC